MPSVVGHRSKKPSPRIDSMCVYNRIDKRERWKPLLIKKRSWITMQQDRRRKINIEQNQFISGWKGKVKEFKIEKRKGMVLVQHVFMHRELQIPKDTSLPRLGPNCKFPHCRNTPNFCYQMKIYSPLVM